jgi:predicted restriction endonuclease
MRAYQINSRIRELARNIYRQSDKPKQCLICGYYLHYEVCHIKSISDFSPDTPISIVNDLSNLIALCPNHHWELDNGHLTLADLKELL